MDIFSESIDPSRDNPRQRVIPSLNPDNPFRVTAEDPYGFWYVSRDHGLVPENLRGAYTSFDKAEVAVKRYIASMQEVKEELNAKVSAPERPLTARRVVSSVS